MTDIESAESFIEHIRDRAIVFEPGCTRFRIDDAIEMTESRDAAIRASACEFHELMRNDLQQILGLEPRASWQDVKNAVKRLVEERAND